MLPFFQLSLDHSTSKFFRPTWLSLRGVGSVGSVAAWRERLEELSVTSYRVVAHSGTIPEENRVHCVTFHNSHLPPFEEVTVFVLNRGGKV